MKSHRVTLCWFSGTGNTRMVTDELGRVLEAAGREVSLVRMRSGPAPELPADTALGLAFPVAYQSTFPFIWDFVYRLPPGGGREAFMVDTLGGFSGGIVGPMGSLLRRKGYTTVGAAEIRMPMNFGRSRRGRRKDADLVTGGIRKASEFAAALLHGRTRWGRVPVLSDLMFLVHTSVVALLFTRWNQRRFGMNLHRPECTGCGICIAECPVSNVTMEEAESGRSYPVFGLRCEFCLHCVSVCPETAVRFRLDRYGRYEVPARETTGMKGPENE